LPPAKPKAKPRKLGYKDQRELDLLPGIIESLEQKVASLQSEMTAPGFYQQDQAAISTINQSMASMESELADCYRRWEELEEIKENGGE